VFPLKHNAAGSFRFLHGPQELSGAAILLFMGFEIGDLQAG
jgi:hypothetical protein